MIDPIEIMTRDQIIEHMDIARLNASAVTGHSQKKHHLAIVALCSLALRGLDATETAQGALAILNVHKLEKATSYDEGFKAGFKAAKEAERWGVAGGKRRDDHSQEEKPIMTRNPQT